MAGWVRPSRLPNRSRSVKQSRSPWLGCSWAPSPAETTEQPTCSATSFGAPLAEWRMFQEMEQARRDNASIPGRGHLVGCGCVFDKLAIRADGAYVPCVMLPTLTLGEIGRNPLPEVWQQAGALQSLRRRRQVRLETFDECRDCPLVHGCTGSCPGMARSLTGEVDRPCPQACLKRFVAELEREGASLWN